MNYSLSKVIKLFSLQETPAYGDEVLLNAIATKEIPNFKRHGGRQRKSWTADQIPAIGEKFGFVKRLDQPKVIYTFVTKGGVLKSSISLNLARLAALHNIRTCVVGLDMQGDVTSALGFKNEIESHEDFKRALQEISQIGGLPEIFNGNKELDEIIQSTDLPTLDFIPETPELVAMERALSLQNRREFWLNNAVVNSLKKRYDLIIMDGSPNWNLLTTNALAACDLLLSPLECKINNFRNFKMFDAFIREFRDDMNVSFKHIYLPSRLHPQRKLSQEIYQWYQDNITNCLPLAIKESTIGEEATAMNLSVSEYSPGSKLSSSYNNVLQKLFLELSTEATDSAKPNRSTKSKEIQDGSFA